MFKYVSYIRISLYLNMYFLGNTNSLKQMIEINLFILISFDSHQSLFYVLF